MSATPHEVVLTQEKDFRFAISFGPDLPVLYGDEGPPLGGGTGPSPEQLLAAAVGNCLSDSLFFALKKFKQDPQGITTHVHSTVGRNAEGRLRILGMDVKVNLGAAAASIENLERILGQFESFCTVAQSVGQGVPIAVSVFDGAGIKVK
jgi:uncharacterized OsmC-like protein